MSKPASYSLFGGLHRQRCRYGCRCCHCERAPYGRSLYLQLSPTTPISPSGMSLASWRSKRARGYQMCVFPFPRSNSSERVPADQSICSIERKLTTLVLSNRIHCLMATMEIGGPDRLAMVDQMLDAVVVVVVIGSHWSRLLRLSVVSHGQDRPTTGHRRAGCTDKWAWFARKAHSKQSPGPRWPARSINRPRHTQSKAHTRLTGLEEDAFYWRGAPCLSRVRRSDE